MKQGWSQLLKSEVGKYMRAKVTCVLVCAALCLLGVSTALFAQGDLAAVTGRVFDPNGAVIVEATVSAKNVDTGVETTVQTNEEGIYRFANLGPGNYEFTVSKHGFKAIVKPGVTLHVADTISMNFNMVVGALTESVIVEAGSTIVNMTDASISTVVDQTYVKNMPLNGRSFQDLILLTPGVVTQSVQNNASLANTAAGNGQTGEFSVNGQRTEANNYIVDGVSANVGAAAGSGMFMGAGASGSVGASTALGTTQALVSVDDLQEFRVESSTYSAQYGRNPGGQFIFETKSGTNQWHGTAFDYLRNGFSDATDWFTGFDGLKQAALRQNDFGGTLGGPVIPTGKDKTFFFASYEGLRLVTPQPAATIQVPDAALRAAAPTPLNQVLNAWPLQSPNAIDDTANGISFFFGSWSNPSAIDSGSIRLDHVVNDKLKLFFRFSDTGSNSLTRGLSFLQSSPPTQNVNSEYTLRTYTAGATSLINSRLSNDFRMNYTSNETTSNSYISAFAGSTPVDLQQLAGLGPGSAVRVTLAPGGHFTDLVQGPQSGKQRQWNFVDTFGVSRGRQQFKFGADYRRLTPVAVQNNPFGDYFYTTAYAPPNSPSTTPSIDHNIADVAALQTLVTAYPRYTNFSAFVEDEWKVSRRLTLSMGLRWEVNPPPGVTQGQGPLTLMPAGLGNWNLAPQGTPLWKTTWYNFAPRLGAAYVLRDNPGWETVLRSGGGVFFDTGQQFGSDGFSGPGFLATNRTSAPFPSTSGPGAIPIPSIPSTPSLADCQCGFGISPHLQLPYTIQWNASIEQALGKSQAFTLSYAASHASRLLQSNLFFDNSGDFLGIGQNGLTADYDSLQTQFQRRLSRGLTALGSYTWSHCIDYGSSNFLVAFQRGNCDMDIRHNFTGAFSYDLPKVGRGGVIGALLNNWGIDDRFVARTGFPVTLGGTESLLPNFQIFFTGLDRVPGQPLYITQCVSPFATGPAMISCPGGRGINPAAFADVGSDPNTGLPLQGNTPRNFVRGFGAWQMNFGIRREFPLYEHLTLQFRAEAFNLFNHPNFGNIETNRDLPTFGEATSTLASSLATVGALNSQYQMGGPRSMQFALRLVF